MKRCDRSMEVEDLALGVRDAELETHVASCASCRVELARFEEERALFSCRETALVAPPDLTLAIDIRLRRDEALEALGRLAPAAPPRALAGLVAAIVSCARSLREAHASWHVVHGVLGAAALAAAFLLVANAGGAARGATSDEATAESTPAPLFTSARLASYVSDEPTTCPASDGTQPAASRAEPLACALDSRAVCEPNAGP